MGNLQILSVSFILVFFFCHGHTGHLLQGVWKVFDGTMLGVFL